MSGKNIRDGAGLLAGLVVMLHSLHPEKWPAEVGLWWVWNSMRSVDRVEFFAGLLMVTVAIVLLRKGSRSRASLPGSGEQ